MLWRRSRGPGGRPADEAAELLETAARGYPRACLRLAFDLFRSGRHIEARAALKRAASDSATWRVPRTAAARAMALRALARDAQRRLKQPDLARVYCEAALDGEAALPQGLRDDLRRRLERLTAL
jgi:hypothetical protein